MAPAESRGKWQGRVAGVGFCAVPLVAFMCRLIIPMSPDAWRVILYAGGLGIVGFVLGLKPALDGRSFCVRLQTGAETHAVDARQVGGKTVVVCGGTTSAKPEPFWTKNAIQAAAPSKSGFFAVFATE